MQAIIMAGGKGTRLPQFSKIMPKPMVEINGKPLLYWIIQNLKAYRVLDIYITTHYLYEAIVNYFGNGKKFGVSITYSYEKELLGTGGALIPIKKYLTDDTLILYGDVFLDIDFGKLLSLHKKQQALITAVIHPSSHPEDSDLVEFDKKFKVTNILKKPHKHIPKKAYNLAALYVISPKVRKFLTLKTPFSFEHDLLPKILENKGSVFCYNTEELIMDIGTPERLRKVTELLKQ